MQQIIAVLQRSFAMNVSASSSARRSLAISRLFERTRNRKRIHEPFDELCDAALTTYFFEESRDVAGCTPRDKASRSTSKSPRAAAAASSPSVESSHQTACTNPNARLKIRLSRSKRSYSGVPGNAVRIVICTSYSRFSTAKSYTR